MSSGSRTDSKEESTIFTVNICLCENENRSENTNAVREIHFQQGLSENVCSESINIEVTYIFSTNI